MYQSSSESSIEHGNFPSVINLYAAGQSPAHKKMQAVKTKKTSSASQTYSQPSRNPLDQKGDPFLALAASASTSTASYPRNQINDDEASYASSPMYAESPTGGCSQPVFPSMTSSAISRSSASKPAPCDRPGSCGSPQSSDSESHSENTPQQRPLSSSSSSTSSEELRPAAFKARIWNAASTGIRKPPAPGLQSQLQHALQSTSVSVHRPALNIVGSPSPSSNTVSSGGGSGSNTGCAARHSLISQFSSVTGRMESVLVEPIVESIALRCTGGVADSGISNTSPETQSSTEFQHSISAKDGCRATTAAAHLLLSGKRSRQHQQHQPLLMGQQATNARGRLVGILKPPSSSPSSAGCQTSGRQFDAQTGYRMQEAFKDDLSNIFSCIYCMLLSSIGMLLPMSALSAVESSMAYSIEGFYIYMYVTAIAFLVYVYAFLVRDGSRSSATADNSLRNRASAARGVRLLRRGAAKGGLYLRLAVIVFGIVSMIRDGISLAASLQFGSQLTECSHPAVPARAALGMAFTFVQLNFIFFMNAKMCIQKYKALVRLGLAHLVATNVCVWLKTLLVDANLISSTATNASQTERNHSLALVVSRNSSCATEPDGFIRDMIDRSEPYLFPITVQYCLLSAAVLSAAWQSFGGCGLLIKENLRCHDVDDSGEEDQDEDDVDAAVDDETTAAAESAAASAGIQLDNQRSPHRLLASTSYRHRNRRSGCSGSHRGLFLGLASLVCSAVSLLTSAALWQQANYVGAASLISHCTELALLTACLAACLLAFPRTADLMYTSAAAASSTRRNCRSSLDETLQLVGFGGGCVYWLAGLTLATKSSAPHQILSSLAQPLQAAVQVALLCTVRHRRCYKALHAREKPGRELVTYLLVANIALLAFATAEPARYRWPPMPLGFSLALRVGLPMHCFYRLHSVAMLADVWKEAYKIKAG